MKSSIKLSLAGLALAGCATSNQLAYQSPPAIVKGYSQQEVIGEVASNCTQNGAIVESQAVNTVTCSKELPIMAQAFMNTRGGSSLQKVQFTVSPEPDNQQRISLAQVWVESVNGFGGVSRTPLPISSPVAQDWQHSIDFMVVRLNARRK